MRGDPLARRTLLDVAFSDEARRRILDEDSRASRYVRLFLRAKAREPFSRADIAMLPRRTVDRRLAEWKRARVLESAGRMRHKLPFNSRARKEAKSRMRLDRGGYRRGRPPERYRIGDPIVRLPGFHQAQVQASIALMRNPAGPQIIAAPLKLGLQLMSTPEGRKYVNDWLIPLFPERLHPLWRDVIETLGHTDPVLLTALPNQVEMEIVAACRDVFPRLAPTLETIAKQLGDLGNEGLRAKLVPLLSDPKM